jgi:glutaredoxin
MKPLILLCGQHCGYCKKAKMLIRRALEKEPALSAVDIRFICDESSEAAAYPHSVVPAFFLGEERLFEGNPDMGIIVSILRKCYES